MRIGYSLVSSEIVPADHAEYGDCAKFQITCPHCREALFKGKRDRPNLSTTHYFSHYKADSEEARRCEMRVASLARPYIAALEALGHAQTLDRFLAVFREAMIKGQDDIGAISGVVLRRDALRIIGRPDMEFWEQPIRKLFDHRAKVIDQSVVAFNAREDFAGSLRKMSALAGKSPFWCRRQTSYALDVLSHLQTHQADANFRFWAACVYSIIHHAPVAFAGGGIHPPKPLTRKIAAGLCDGRSTLFLRRVCQDHYLTTTKKAHDAGTKAADDTFNMMLTLSGNGPVPVGRAALMSSAGGEVFRTAARVPMHDIAAVAKIRIGELEREERRLTDSLQSNVDELTILSLAADAWGPATALLACAPFPDMITEAAK